MRPVLPRFTSTKVAASTVMVLGVGVLAAVQRLQHLERASRGQQFHRPDHHRRVAVADVADGAFTADGQAFDRVRICGSTT